MSTRTTGVFQGGHSRRNFLRISGLTGLGYMLGSRAQASEPHPIRMPYNNLSDEDEIQLGKIIAADIEKDVQIIRNPLIDTYLTGLVEKLSRASQRPNLPYYIRLVNTEEINAFSIAGGGIYLNRGLVEFIDKEDELVATLAHEIGHVVGRHSANQIMLTFRARQAYALVRDNILAHAKQIQAVIERLGGALAMIALLHFSREDELQADMLGFYEMMRAGYQPGGFLDLFQSLDALEQKEAGSLPSPILRSHPPAAERGRAIRQELKEVNVPQGANEDSFQFHGFKLAMNLLPAPPPPPKASSQQ